MGEEMGRYDLIAILTSILQVAEQNGEEKTKEHIERILQSIVPKQKSNRVLDWVVIHNFRYSCDHPLLKT